MKQLKMILLIVLWLASQQAAANMSAVMSGQLPLPAPRVMQMGCAHDDSSSVTAGAAYHGEQAGNHEQMQPGSSCCQLSCQCSISGGPAMPVSVSGAVFVSHHLNHEASYLLVVPHPPVSSFFRPPIWV